MKEPHFLAASMLAASMPWSAAGAAPEASEDTSPEPNFGANILDNGCLSDLETFATLVHPDGVPGRTSK